MNKKYIIGLSAVAILFVLQLILVKQENPAVKNSPNWDSPETKATFMRVCGDCHSNETKWPWYSHIPPVSFLVEYDVKEGREHFNISEYVADDGVKSAHEFKTGEMPMWIYTIMHSEAVLSETESAEFIRGLEATFGKYDREELEKNQYSHPE